MQRAKIPPQGSQGQVMKQVKLDRADTAIQDFIRALPLNEGGVQLSIQGRVVCQVLPPLQPSGAEKRSVLKRGWELIRRAQQRNRRVPSRVINQEIRAAIKSVRGS